MHLTGACGIPAWTGGALHARSLGPKSHPCKPSIHDQDVWSPYVTKEPSPRMRRERVYLTLRPLEVTVHQRIGSIHWTGRGRMDFIRDRKEFNLPVRKTRPSHGARVTPDSAMAAVGVAGCMDRSPYGLCCHRCCHGYGAALRIPGKAGGAVHQALGL